MGQVSIEEDIKRRADENRFMTGGMDPDLQQFYVAPVEKPDEPAREELLTARIPVPKPRSSRVRDRPVEADPLRRRANISQKLKNMIRDEDRKRRPIIVD